MRARLVLSTGAAALTLACAARTASEGVTPLRQIAPGQEATDRLRRSDPRIENNRPHHVWLLQGTPGQRVVIEMLSSDFDAHIILQDATGAEVARDDDGGEGLNARLRYTIQSASPYRVVANSYRPNRHGRYTLRVSEAGAIPTLRTGVKGTIARGETRHDRFVPGDPIDYRVTELTITMDRQGRARTTDVRRSPFEYHAYLYQAQAGETITVELRSADIDPFVVIQEADGTRLVSDDDGGEANDARLTYTFPYAGTFRIVATVTGSGRYGGYQLIVH